MPVFNLPHWSHPDFYDSNKTPRGDIELDKNQSLTNGLLSASVAKGSGWVDYVSNHKTRVPGKSARGIIDGHATTNVESTTHSGAILEKELQLLSGEPFSFVWLANKDINGGNAGMVAGNPTVSTNYLWMTSVNKRVDIRIAGGSAKILTGDTDHVEHIWRQISSDGVTFTLYENGVAVDTTSAYIGTMSVTSIAGGYNSTSFNLDGNLTAMYIYARDMGPFAKVFARDPYCIFKPVVPLTFISQEAVAAADSVGDGLISGQKLSRRRLVG